MLISSTRRCWLAASNVIVMLEWSSNVTSKCLSRRLEGSLNASRKQISPTQPTIFVDLVSFAFTDFPSTVSPGCVNTDQRLYNFSTSSPHASLLPLFFSYSLCVFFSSPVYYFPFNTRRRCGERSCARQSSVYSKNRSTTWISCVSSLVRSRREVFEVSEFSSTSLHFEGK